MLIVERFTESGAPVLVAVDDASRSPSLSTDQPAVEKNRCARA
jgi:hypothetical protein